MQLLGEGISLQQTYTAFVEFRHIRGISATFAEFHNDACVTSWKFRATHGGCSTQLKAKKTRLLRGN